MSPLQRPWRAARAIARIVAWIARRPYLIAITLFLLWVALFDANSLRAILHARGRIDDLKARRQYYIQQIQADRLRIHQLRSDRDDLERYARETYYMRAPNEDLFIVEAP